MKIQRQNLSEEYSATADWLSDFANGMTKSADYLDNLRSIMKRRSDFSTIEEKMADLKDRAGFNIIKTVDSAESHNEKLAEASCCDSCDVGQGCSSCSCGKAKCPACNAELFASIRNVLSYISAFAKDRPETGYSSWLSECRDHPNLGFNQIEERVDPEMMKSLTGKVVGRLSGVRENNLNDVKYNPESDASTDDKADIAEYMAHAQTG